MSINVKCSTCGLPANQCPCKVPAFSMEIIPEKVIPPAGMTRPDDYVFSISMRVEFNDKTPNREDAIRQAVLTSNLNGDLNEFVAFLGKKYGIKLMPQ